MATLSKLTKPGRYRDKDWPRGLYLQVGPTGKKSWLLRYEINGRDRRLQTGKKSAERMMGLGPFPEFSLKQARERALAARQLLADKVDPIEQRKAERDAQAKRGHQQHHIQAGCGAIHRAPQRRLAKRQASAAVEQHAARLCLSGARAETNIRHRRRRN